MEVNRKGKTEILRNLGVFPLKMSCFDPTILVNTKLVQKTVYYSPPVEGDATEC